jgi:secreted trypsin-like serine protease
LNGAETGFLQSKRKRTGIVRALGEAAGLLAVVALCATAGSTVARALTGDSAVVAAGERHEVIIVGSGGTFCTGVAIAQDLVLTAAHCVLPGREYKIMEFDAARRPHLLEILRTAIHPAFNVKALLAHRATADVALLKLARPLPAQIVPTTFMSTLPGRAAAGDRYTVRGYGVALPGDGRTGGTLRSADLAATGQPGNLQIRLVDPGTAGLRPGRGACTGDSGAPVYAGRTLVGLVSWSTGPNQSAGCGGLTGVTPLTLYRSWIIRTAQALGSPLL